MEILQRSLEVLYIYPIVKFFKAKQKGTISEIKVNPWPNSRELLTEVNYSMLLQPLLRLCHDVTLKQPTSHRWLCTVDNKFHGFEICGANMYASDFIYC